MCLNHCQMPCICVYSDCCCTDYAHICKPVHSVAASATTAHDHDPGLRNLEILYIVAWLWLYPCFWGNYLFNFALLLGLYSFLFSCLGFHIHFRLYFRSEE